MSFHAKPSFYPGKVQGHKNDQTKEVEELYFIKRQAEMRKRPGDDCDTLYQLLQSIIDHMTRAFKT